MEVVNYLDVHFNLNDKIEKPYTKPNNEIKYIHKDSNHPPSVIYQIPLSTAQKLNFPLLISSVNVTKSAGNCRFGHIY